MMSKAFNIGPVALPPGDYLPIAGLTIPVVSGLTGAFLFGSGRSLIAKNWAAAGNDATIVGNPVSVAGRTAFDGSNYLQTDIAETSALSFVSIFRRPVDGNIGIVGNFGGGVNMGACMYGGAGSTLAQMTVDRSAGVGGSTPGNIGGFTLLTLSAQATGQTILRNETEPSTLASLSGTRIVSGIGPYRIGRLPFVTFGGAHDQVLSLIYNRDITAPERILLVAWARAYAASVGITV